MTEGTQSVEAPVPDEGIRRRKSKGGWRYRKPPDLTLAQETTFLNMQLRKTSRALSGAKTRNTNYEFVALAVLLVIIYSLGAQSAKDDATYNSQFFVTLTLGQVVAIGIWMFVAAFVTATFSQSRFIVLLYWMFIYLPLIAMMASFMFDTQQHANNQLSYFNYGQILGIVLITAEILAVAIFVSIFYLYPRHINSSNFRRKRKAAKFWRIKTVADWTMTYLSQKTLLRDRRTCKYQGETNAEGLPHGYGRWFDDSTDGEILTGTWKEGLPVAPFVSRHYGRGDAFNAVRIAYVMASDDDFSTTQFWPSNKNPPRCGYGSVECSVSGLFYNELPRASPIQEDMPYDEQTSIATLCSGLSHLGEENEKRHSMLFINADDPRGIQIHGHVHANTGKSFNKVDEILIKVQPLDAPKSSTRRTKMEHMPKSRRGSLFRPDVVAVREEVPDEEETKGEPNNAVVPMAPIAEGEDLEKVEVGLNGTNDSAKPSAEVTLSIRDWRPTKTKDALLYFGGFNCPLKTALEGFGQFLAMTKLDAEIYPILYGWPCGQVLSYHSASRSSHREQNKKNMMSFIRGIQAAGIRNVHLMTHSMGVQPLVGAFVDNEDGTRSDFSKCFRLAPDWENKDTKLSDRGVYEEGTDEDDDGLLICKTVTLLNPDYPLESFVTHSFRSIRRICDTITVVGDVQDGALLNSQWVNGVGVYFGYKQPRELEPNTWNQKKLCFQKVVGKNIEELYFTEPQDPNECLLFTERAPLKVVGEEEDLEEEKLWLDLDVIDTSGLDTNIAGIRHSAFNMNPMLLNDLEELIKTNQRAMKRSSLLYRDGNIFSYCHAPSYVSY